MTVKNNLKELNNTQAEALQVSQKQAKQKDINIMIYNCLYRYFKNNLINKSRTVETLRSERERAAVIDKMIDLLSEYGARRSYCKILY